MKRNSIPEQLQRLGERERQLVERRRALEARAASAAKKDVVRQEIVVGRTVLRWVRSNEGLPAVIRSKLRPYASDRDWWIIDRTLPTTATPQEMKHEAQE